MNATTTRESIIVANPNLANPQALRGKASDAAFLSAFDPPQISAFMGTSAIIVSP